jgi:hypothetical protein
MSKTVTLTFPNPSEIRKTVVALTALVGQIVALGVLHGAYLADATYALSALTAIGVFFVPNAPAIPAVVVAPVVEAVAPQL